MKPLIIANWKMNPLTVAEAEELFISIGKGIKDIQKAEVVICPPFIYLPILNSKELSPNVSLGGQDCFWEEKGAFTGEISPKQLSNLGCEYVILGHSERRINLKENDAMINKKIKTVLGTGLKAIFYVGGKSKNMKEVSIQLKKGLAGFKKSGFKSSNLIIVYEPIYAISTMSGGKAISPEEVIVGIISIKKILSQILGKEFSSQIKILYGGSVNSENARDFILKSKVDGLLVGGASLKTEEFVKIVKGVSEI